ncbi:MAG: hypothetical protein KO202_02060 [Methanobacteriaceae archaeon]|jgi:hypothetical protein|nr:hypothetical protein [Methanobacteriaceae archaeon]
MSDLKNIKEIELSSSTIIGSGIFKLFGVLFAIVILIIAGIYGGINAVTGFISIACTIIFGAIIFGVFNTFTQTYLYNFFSKKLSPISFNIKDNKTIERISALPAAIIISLISLIILVICFLASNFILQMLLTSIIQIMMFSGQSNLALLLYQYFNVFSNPLSIILVLIGSYITIFVTVAISATLYNELSSKILQIKVKLSSDGNYTSLDYVKPLNLAIISAIIALIVSIIFGMVIALYTGSFLIIAINGVIGFVFGFIITSLIAIFYNYLSKFVGPIKIKLTD